MISMSDKEKKYNHIWVIKSSKNNITLLKSRNYYINIIIIIIEIY